MNMPVIVGRILSQYTLPLDGLHGVIHWARVMENGLRLAPKTGADEDVVRLFAVFHDACRVSEGRDHSHGLRGAELAALMRGKFFSIDDDQFSLLYQACADHTLGQTVADVTVQTCWDADRLDLPRCGTRVHPGRLCTEAAREPHFMHVTSLAASFESIPPLIEREWGILPSQLLGGVTQ